MMKRALLLSVALSFVPRPVVAKDVVMAPAEYQMYTVYASRGLDKQCAVITSSKDLVDMLTKLRVSKPEAVPGLITPPINWNASAVLLMYQPDPPPETFPAVRSLIKDVNREKFTLLFRYLTAKEFAAEETAAAAAAAAAATPAPTTSPVAVAAAPVAKRAGVSYTIGAYTVGTDDQRDRSKHPSPLLLLVIPKLPFVNNQTAVESTPKT